MICHASYALLGVPVHASRNQVIRVVWRALRDIDRLPQRRRSRRKMYKEIMREHRHAQTVARKHLG